MKRIDISLAAGLVLAVFIMSFATFAKDCGEMRQNVLRLHIMANSDSAADQDLKLCVRDKILSETSDMFSVSGSKTESEMLAENSLDKIESIAREEVLRQGYEYSVKAEFVNMFFETKIYDGVSMPAGRYDAVRVSIGDGDGKNWWCVLFPPMCVPAASEKQDAKLQIEHLGEQPRYVPKLAVLELIESAKNGDSGESGAVK